MKETTCILDVLLWVHDNETTKRRGNTRKHATTIMRSATLKSESHVRGRNRSSQLGLHDQPPCSHPQQGTLRLWSTMWMTKVTRPL